MNFDEAIEKHPAKEQRLTKLKKRYKDAEILLDLKENAGVKALVKEAETIIAGINHRLLNERMTEHERDLLFLDRDRLNWFLYRFAYAEVTKVNIEKYLDKL